MRAVVAAALAVLGPAPAAHPVRAAVPILMYHVVAPPPPHAAYPQLYVQPADFERQMLWLRNHHWHAVTLERVYRAWTTGRRLPRRPIVLSFDDGYRSDYTHALPVLRALHWRGVLNLLVANTRHRWGLTPRHVRALLRAGWEVDSHTLTHPDLRTLDAAQLRHEISGSRRALRREFGIPVNFFCYPSGKYDRTVVAEVRAAGYEGATTVRFGLGRRGDLFTLARVRVDGSDGVAGLARKLRELE